VGKRSLQSDAEIKAEVDGLLGAFGVVGEADPSFEDDDRPKLKSGEKAGTPIPSADADALWGGAPKKK